jgi:hypothetical protein
MKEIEMTRKLKLLGAAVLALWAAAALAGVANAAAQDPDAIPDAFYIGISALTACAVAAAVSRIGATRRWTPSGTLTSRSSTTTITSGTPQEPAFNAITTAPQLLGAAFTTRVFTSNDIAETNLGGEEIDHQESPRNVRIRPTISPVMAS